MIDPISLLAGKLVGKVGEKWAKPAAIAILAVTAGVLLIGLKAAYDSSVVQNALTEARAEFLEDKDEATGAADAVFNEHQETLSEDVKKTEELIDEAIKNGCAVGEYLASDGANCVQ